MAGSDKMQYKRKAADAGFQAREHKKSTFKGKAGTGPVKGIKPVDTEGEGREEDGMEIDETDGNGQAGNPGSAREARQAQKALIAQRKASRPHADLLSASKAALSSLHSAYALEPVDKKARADALQALLGVVTGNMKLLLFKHDASRIVQALIKFGNKEVRMQVASEIDPDWLPLIQDKYGKFLVSKVIRYCPPYRPKILSALQAHIPKLILHKTASPVIEEFYNAYASAEERKILLRSFYGKEFNLLLPVAAQNQDLLQLIQSQTPPDGPKSHILLGNIRQMIQTISDHPDKASISYSIIHRLLLEYMQSLPIAYPAVDDADKKRRELLETLGESIAEIVHTRDGSQVVRDLIAFGTAKDRKVLVKVLKPHVVAMSKDDFAQTVLMTLFDCVDDTKLIKTSIFPDLVKRFSELAHDKVGRRILFYLLTPRDSRYFIPAIVRCLQETDEASRRTSKKDTLTRQRELRDALAQDITSAVDEDLEPLVRGTATSLVVLEAMLRLQSAHQGDLISKLTALTAQPFEASRSRDDNEKSLSSEQHIHILSLSHVAKMFKTLMQGGHYSQKSGTVDDVDAGLARDFALAFYQTAKASENLVAYAQESGTTFVLLAMVQRLQSSAGPKVVHELKSMFSAEDRQKISETGAKGSNLLLDAVAKL